MLRLSKSQRFYRLLMFATLYALVLLVLSAWWRSNEAGLGCPDWPGCYGRLFAPQTAQDLSEARSVFPRQPGEEEKMLKDTLQRYISGALGLLMFPLVNLGWHLKKHVRRQQVLLPVLVFLLVFVQVAMSIATVKLQHKPLITMLQLSANMLILGLLWWTLLREQRFWRPVAAAPATLRRLRPRALFGLLLVIVQFALGGWVSANYAAMACPDFPTCQGTYWPGMDFLSGFVLWRDIGIDYEGIQLNLEAATSVHMAHRLGALISLLYVGWLALHTIRLGANDQLCRYGLLVLVLLLIQTTLGIITVLMHLPVPVVVAHSAAGALLIMSLITLNHAVRPRP